MKCPVPLLLYSVNSHGRLRVGHRTGMQTALGRASALLPAWDLQPFWADSGLVSVPVCEVKQRATAGAREAKGKR